MPARRTKTTQGRGRDDDRDKKRNNKNRPVSKEGGHGSQAKATKRKNEMSNDAQSKRGRSRSREHERQNDTTEVEFIDDDQVILMTTQGQESEYFSDGDEPSLGEDEENMEVDEEVTLNTSRASRNNNATGYQETAQVEEGEIENSSGNPSSKAKMAVNERKEIMNEAVGQAVEQVKNLITQSGLLETASLLQQQLKRQEETIAQLTKERNAGKKTNQHVTVANDNLHSNSEVTVYKNALRDDTGKRNSSSSEDDVEANSSGENLILGIDNQTNDVNDEMINNFISEQRRCSEDTRRVQINRGKVTSTEPQPSTSGAARPEELTPEDRAREIIKQAEVAKGRIYQTPGELNFNPVDNTEFGKANYDFNICKNYVHSAMVDEHYQTVGSHVDEAIKMKIVNGQYVDFAKLVSKDRVALEEDHAQYRPCFKGGMQFWTPVNDQTINSFGKWEQAFRVFSNIYLKAFPHKATELVEYNHIIHTAAQEFTWPNVYRYDREFRVHLSQYPNRSWGIILNKAWTMHLRERVHHHFSQSPNNSSYRHDEGGNGDCTCRRFNKGKCMYGANCRYEHKCKHCKKWGHGMHTCRKFKAERGDSSNSYQYQPTANNAGKSDKPPNASNVANLGPGTAKN